MDQKENKLPDTLFKLVEGCSTYLKVSITFWIALAIFSVIIVLPAETDDGKVLMPFNLGKISKQNFFPFANVFICVLLISFGSTLCQAIRTRMLIQRIADKRRKEQPYTDGIHIQDIIDSIVYPNLSRVAPLAHALQGRKYQFFPEAEAIPKWRKEICFYYYGLLKIISACILYFLPTYAVAKSFIEGQLYKSDSNAWNIPVIVFWVLNVIALFILVQLLIMDMFYIKGVRKRIFKKKVYRKFENDKIHS